MRSPALRLKLALAAVAVATLAGCGADVKYDAAQDVHAFLVAVRTSDDATFERHVDRPALRAVVAADLQEALEGQGAGALGAALGRGAVESAADRLITPETFSFAAQQGGITRTPSAAEIASQLKVLDPGRVCLQSQGACALTFASRDGVWKLVAIDTAGLQVSSGGAGRAP